MSKVVLYACIFMFGASVESAIMCAAYRIPRHMDWLRGHSVCESCGATLRWWELIPVFSALFLRGKCARCGAKFGLYHSALEALVGGLFVSCFALWKIDALAGVAYLCVTLTIQVLGAISMEGVE